MRKQPLPSAPNDKKPEPNPAARIEVRQPSTMGSDFSAQFARARQLRAQQEAKEAKMSGQEAVQGEDLMGLPVPVVSLSDFKKAQANLGDDTKEEEQAMVFGHQGGMASPGKTVSDSLDTFLARVERGRGMVEVSDPAAGNKEPILNETTDPASV